MNQYRGRDDNNEDYDDEYNNINDDSDSNDSDHKRQFKKKYDGLENS